MPEGIWSRISAKEWERGEALIDQWFCPCEQCTGAVSIVFSCFITHSLKSIHCHVISYEGREALQKKQGMGSNFKNAIDVCDVADFYFVFQRVLSPTSDHMSIQKSILLTSCNVVVFNLLLCSFGEPMFYTAKQKSPACLCGHWACIFWPMPTWFRWHKSFPKVMSTLQDYQPKFQLVFPLPTKVSKALIIFCSLTWLPCGVRCVQGHLIISTGSKF